MLMPATAPETEAMSSPMVNEEDIYLDHYHEDYCYEETDEDVPGDGAAAIEMYYQFFEQQQRIAKNLDLENAKKHRQRIAEAISNCPHSGITTGSTVTAFNSGGDSSSSAALGSLENGDSLSSISSHVEEPPIFSILRSRDGTQTVKVPLTPRTSLSSCRDDDQVKVGREKEENAQSSSSRSPTRKKHKEYSALSQTSSSVLTGRYI